MLARTGYVSRVSTALASAPVVAILGPRQCGKTTLARQISASLKHTWFDLEDPVSQRQLESPELAFRHAEDLVVLDEVQHRPELLSLIRVIVDREPERRFLLLGSASPELVEHSAQSLAGRVEYVELGGFLISEAEPQRDLWVRGGFPRSFLAADDERSAAWRHSFVRTFLERDLGRFETRTPTATMRRFWTMVAHYHGQTWNAADFSRSLDVNSKTARRYLDILEGTFVVRQLHPWFENLGKRLVKAPKVYVRDSGLLHALLGLTRLDDILGHPRAGASWEGFALEQVLAHVDGDPYFWATHGGAELDLLLLRRRRRWGFEFKLSEAPKVTKSMHLAANDLKLDHLWVVHAGEERIHLADDITAIPLGQVPKLEKAE